MSDLKQSQNSIEQFVKELDINYPIFRHIRDLTTFEKIPRVYRNEDVELDIEPGKPWIVMINGTMGSGKSTLAQYLEGKGVVSQVKTATSRLRRADDDASSYLFMRLRKQGESIEKYHQSLIEEYNLIESDMHHGNIYGLPKESLQEVLEAGKVPLIVNDPDGVKDLTQILDDQFNIVAIFIIPDSWISVLKRVNQSGSVRDNLKQRFVDSVEMLRQSEQTAHFYLHNSQFSFDSTYQTGLAEASDYLLQLVELLVNGKEGSAPPHAESAFL